MFSCQDLQLFSLNPVVQSPESVRVSYWSVPRPPRGRDGEEGGAATKDGAEQSAREQNSGKGLRGHTPTSVQTHHHASIPRSPNTYCSLYSTVHTEGRTLIFLTQAYKESSTVLQSGPLSPSVPVFFSNPGKNPLSPLAWTYVASAFLQYDVSSHLWPQLGRMSVSQEKGISALCGALGHPLLGALVLMPHTKVMPNTAM